MKLFVNRKSRTSLEFSRTRKVFDGHFLGMFFEEGKHIVSEIRCAPTELGTLGERSQVKFYPDQSGYNSLSKLFIDLRNYCIDQRTYPPLLEIDPFFDDWISTHGRDLDLFELFQKQVKEPVPKAEDHTSLSVVVTHVSYYQDEICVGAGRTMKRDDRHELRVTYDNKQKIFEIGLTVKNDVTPRWYQYRAMINLKGRGNTPLARRLRRFVNLVKSGELRVGMYSYYFDLFEEIEIMRQNEFRYDPLVKAMQLYRSNTRDFEAKRSRVAKKKDDNTYALPSWRTLYGGDPPESLRDFVTGRIH